MSEDRDFEDLEEFVQETAKMARKLAEESKKTDRSILDISFQPCVNSEHTYAAVYRYLPPDRGDLQEENERLKAEIEKLKSEKSGEKKRKTAK